MTAQKLTRHSGGNGADSDRTQHYFDGGFTVKLTPDVQCDIRAGNGLNDAADDYFIGTGLSWRMR
ncbi:MAG: transporter [Planctomycetaceae bacterium]|nr:transporter [Planctomycetaceae bacterium]